MPRGAGLVPWATFSHSLHRIYWYTALLTVAALCCRGRTDGRRRAAARRHSLHTTAAVALANFIALPSIHSCRSVTRSRHWCRVD